MGLDRVLNKVRPHPCDVKTIFGRPNDDDEETEE